jgi:hypothetical protein
MLALMVGLRDWCRGEPALEDVLSDPIVHGVMKRDGIEMGVLRNLLRDAKRSLETPAKGTDKGSSFG